RLFFSFGQRRVATRLVSPFESEEVATRVEVSMSDHQDERESGDFAVDERAFEENLAHLLAAGETPPSLPTDQAARMLRQLRIQQQAQYREQQRELAEPRLADIADSFAKERTMHRPNTFAAHWNNGQLNNGQLTPGTLAARPKSRRHWQS